MVAQEPPGSQASDALQSKRLCWSTAHEMSPVRTLEVVETSNGKGLAMESIAVPVSLTLELQPEGADIGSLERAVSAGLAEAGRQLWVEIIGTLERCARPDAVATSAVVASSRPTGGHRGAS